MNAAERDAPRLGAKDGRLMRADGTAMDTQDAARTSLVGGTGGTNIFAFHQDFAGGDKLFAADATAETRQSKADALDAHAANLEDKSVAEAMELDPASAGGREAIVEHVHHSSFTGGGSLQGAGELDVKDGWLKTLSNNSGHYQPDMQSSVQSLEALDRMGVNTDATKVDHVSKDAQGRILHSEYAAPAVRASQGNEFTMHAHKANQMEFLHGERAPLKHVETKGEDRSAHLREMYREDQSQRAKGAAPERAEDAPAPRAPVIWPAEGEVAPAAAPEASPEADDQPWYEAMLARFRGAF
jgi:hypothetical protein